MSTGDVSMCRGVRPDGFTALELLLGVALTILLALGCAPLVFSIQQTGSRDADRTVRVEQARVAAARLEKDLRTGTAVGCPFVVSCPILQATPKQIVFLGTREGVEGLTLFEWEVAGSSLMRRWGPCPSSCPESFPHSLYADNKTMLEGLAGDTCFSYLPDRPGSEGPVASAELWSVTGVRLRGGGKDSLGLWSMYVDSVARVGR